MYACAFIEEVSSVNSLNYGLLLNIISLSLGYLMQEFHRFWIEEDPCDIMEFNRVRTKFHKRIVKQLKNPNMALCPHFTASDLHLVNM